MPFQYVAFPSLFILNTVDSLFYVCNQFHNSTILHQMARILKKLQVPIIYHTS